ncbi:hypothetical protein [Kitasatospora sp. NPDC050543]|uniref:hypothetical protein n=1 Tax=Kitasatospora sp. NPDC050543 TaxID=3364054 RepID=UPI0037A9F5B4
MTKAAPTSAETGADTGTGIDVDDLTPAAPTGPWSVRGTGRRQVRPALEVYEDGELLDVVVLSRLSPALLCGARRGTGGGRPLGLAWGRLPLDGTLPTVEFARGGLRRGRRSAPVVTVQGAFWLAWAEGEFAAVRARYDGGPCERMRLHRARASVNGGSA